MKKLNIGGQAVIEGVMLKSPSNLVISVRNLKNKIISKKEKSKPKSKFLKLPFIRGITNLIEMLIIGMKAITWSANQSLEADKQEKFSVKDLILVFTISIGFVILFFIALPYFLTLLLGVKEEANPVIFNLIDGVIKIGVFVLYIAAISLMKDARILFRYHGAEHKVVHCYEKDKKLTVKNAKKFSTLHPRCGTSFLMIVLVVSIILFALLPIIVTNVYTPFLTLKVWLQKSILFPLRILIIPIIAGVSYEILRISAKYNNIFTKILTAPGLWLQKMTTKEPSTKQLEVAIDCMKKLNALEKK